MSGSLSKARRCAAHLPLQQGLFAWNEATHDLVSGTRSAVEGNSAYLRLVCACQGVEGFVK